MEGGYDASTNVANQNSLNARDAMQQEATNSDRPYQQQQPYLPNPILNQSIPDRPMEIPAAKVHSL